jgi:hypothetical protein
MPEARLGSFVAIAWVRPEQQPGAAIVGYRLRDCLSHPGLGSILLLTNDPTVDEAGLAPTGPRVEVIGPEAIEALLAKHARVPRLVPSLYGVRNLDGLASSSSWDLAAASELASVFVPTRAYRAALVVLERHNFAVLSGPPEMGKTAIARVLGLALQVEGWEVHECIRPEQIWQAFDRDARQLFIADDAFGSTEYRPDAAERWSVDLPRILQAMDAQHKLVWTSRPAPLRAGLARIHREHGVERFPQPAEVSVDATDLDLEEKATILLRHAQAAPLEGRAVRIVRGHGSTIVDHPHFTPERIRRFVRTRLPQLAAGDESLRDLRPAIELEIAEPTEAMAASFAALGPEHRALLVALVDSPPGAVRERDLATAMRRHAPGGLPAPVNELIDRLRDHFVRVLPPDGVTWVHPSWRDLVIDELVMDDEARSRFLERCSLEGALLALSRGGGRLGERRWPFLVTHGDWDRVAERLNELGRDLADPDVLRLLATLEDGFQTLRGPELTEFAAVAEAALRGLASAWRTGRSYATADQLLRFNSLWDELGRPSLELEVRMWSPERGERYQGAVERHHAAPLPPVDWDESSWGDAIVERILSDLD